ncbi:MAG TPA: protein kinase [Ktedonobacteraceae bacterium]|nr:protein kinase [Ktedonobacteraceae bacterium]
MLSTCFCPTCGAANEPSASHCFSCQAKLADGSENIQPSETLGDGRYHLKTFLGSGGFSAVYRAEDTREKRDVAIKRIHLRGLSSQEIIESTETFHREVSLLSGLAHPQIPRFYEQFQDQEHWYVVLEYIAGQTLESLLTTRGARGDSLSLEEILDLGLQLCTVLTYLHSRQPPIIFRDLKPSNIICTPEGKFVLIDFGIARQFRPRQARDTQNLGSPGYAAPEQYGKGQTTPRSDIYSLGALLRQILTGQDPSEDSRALPPLRFNGQPGSKEVYALVDRMLLPSPEDRPASCSEVASTLQAIKDQHQTHHTARIWQPPVPQQTTSDAPQQLLHTFSAQAKQHRTTRRNMLIKLGVGALAVAGVGIGGGSLWWANRFRPSVTYTGHATEVRSISWSADGRFIVSGSIDGTAQIWKTSNGELVQTFGSHVNAGIDALAWSPDGKYIALGSGAYLGLFEQATGTLFGLNQSQIAKSFVSALAWSPDGQYLTAGYSSGFLQVWSLNGMLPLEEVQNDRIPVASSAISSLAWSPDSTRFTVAARDDDNVIVCDLSNNMQSTFYQGEGSIQMKDVAWSPNNRYIVASYTQSSASAVDAADTILIWEEESAFPTYNGYSLNIRSVTWSLDSESIIFVSSEEIKTWDIATNKQTVKHKFESRIDTPVSWSPDRKRLATTNGTIVKIWTIS